jgi:uncharacterized membrane protein
MPSPDKSLNIKQFRSDQRVLNDSTGFRSCVYFVILYAVVVSIYFFGPLFGGGWPRKLLGTSLWAPDNILNAGILEWGWRSLWSRRLHVFDWVAGYPMSNSLAGTENLIGWQIFFSPLRALGVGAVPSMNTIACLSFLISAMGGAVFARHIGLRSGAAFSTGLIFAFAPTHTLDITQFQSLAICWMPWSVVFIDSFARSGRRLDLIGAVVTTCLTFLSGMYIGIGLCIAIGIWLPVRHLLGVSKLTRTRAVRISEVALSCGLLLLPVFVHYIRFNHEHGLTLSTSYMSAHSLDLVSFLKGSRLLASWNLLLGEGAVNGPGGFFPGFTILVLFVAALWAPLFSKQWKVSLLVAGVALAVLACGPFLKVTSSPLGLADFRIPLPGLLLRLIPGLRVPSRLVLPALLFLSALCGAGVTTFTSRFGRKALCLIVFCLLGELYPASWLIYPSVELPPPAGIAQAYQHLEGCHAAVEIPVSESVPADLLARYVYGASSHLHPVVSYYASVWPKEVQSLQRLASTLPNDEGRERLLQAGVNCVVLHKEPLGNEYSKLLDMFIQNHYLLAFAGEDSAVILLSHP